jgi:phosphatidylglycerophosphatase A
MEPAMPRPPNPPASVVFRDPIHLLAFGFGSGLAKYAPGTFGSLAALVLYFAIAGLPGWAYLTVAVVVTVAGFHICGESARRLGVHDHPGIVWDEWAGMLITLAFAPAGLTWVLVGFLLFRLFDILKPFPARYFDRHWHSGAGIVMDDVVAGLYAWLALQALAWAFYAYS